MKAKREDASKYRRGEDANGGHVKFSKLTNGQCKRLNISDPVIIITIKVFVYRKKIIKSPDLDFNRPFTSSDCMTVAADPESKS